MQLNMFVYGYAMQTNIRQDTSLPRLAIPNVLQRSLYTAGAGMPFSTASLLPPPQREIVFRPQLQAIGVEHYNADPQLIRQNAIMRAAQSAVSIGRREDGSIWVDEQSLNDPLAALTIKRETGGEERISWSHVEFNLHTRSMSSGSGVFDQVALSIDYYASEYAQYKARIERQYEGGELARELQQLERVFASAARTSADYFATATGGFLEEAGVLWETESIRASYLDMYEQRKAQYMSFVADNPDYAGVIGGEDEWLLTAGDFMGEQLRYAMISANPSMDLASDNGYSIEELQALGTFVKEISIMRETASPRYSEEELGVELGLVAMKYALITEHYRIGNRVKSKLDQALAGFMQHEMDKVVSYMDQQRRDPYVRFKEAYAVDFDQQFVLSVISRMVNYLRSDNMNASFHSGWNNLVSLYLEKSGDAQYGMLNRYGPLNGDWTHKHYANDWNRFVRQLNTFNSGDLSRDMLEERLKLDIKV